SRGAIASELCIETVPLGTEGAGKAGCPPHPRPPCIKKHGEGTQVEAESSGLPCAMVLRYTRSPRGPGFLAPVARKPLIERIASSASASGGQDHTISPSASASVVLRKAPDLPRPSHPASYVRDDRETPLVWRRDGREDASDLGRRQVEF